MFSRAHASFFTLETREFVVFIRVQFLAASRSSCHAKDAVDNDQAILVLMAHSLQPNSEHEELNTALLLLFVIVFIRYELQTILQGFMCKGLQAKRWTTLLLRDCNCLPKNIRVDPIQNRLHNFC